jgi:hypothetical protein
MNDGIILLRIIIFLFLCGVWQSHYRQQKEITNELKQINKRLESFSFAEWNREES